MEKVVENEEVVVRKRRKSSFPVSTNSSMQTNSTHVGISAPQNKCTALKCTEFKRTHGSMKFGTELLTFFLFFYEHHAVKSVVNFKEFCFFQF